MVTAEYGTCESGPKTVATEPAEPAEPAEPVLVADAVMEANREETEADAEENCAGLAVGRGPNEAGKLHPAVGQWRSTLGAGTGAGAAMATEAARAEV